MILFNVFINLVCFMIYLMTKMRMSGWFLGLLVLLLTNLAYAQEPEFSIQADVRYDWERPMTRENGLQLDPNEILGYKLYLSPKVGTDLKTEGQEIIVMGSDSLNHTFSGSISTTVADLLDGTVDLRGAVLTVDTDSRESVLSDEAVAVLTVPQSLIDFLTNSPPSKTVVVSATGTITFTLEE